MCKECVSQHGTRTTKTATPRARSRLQVTVDFHVVRRVVSLDLGFHVVIGIGRLNVQQDGFLRQLHFTTQTQHQVQSSFLLDRSHRCQSVSRRLLCSMDQGNLMEREWSINQEKSCVTFDVISAHNNFYEAIHIWRIVDQDNLMSETARKHRLGLYLKSRHRQLSRNIAKKSVITQKKNAEFYKDNYGDRNWNFVKLIKKVLQKWRNYGNSKVLLSMRSRDENSSRIRTLFWNYHEEYRKCKMQIV